MTADPGSGARGGPLRAPREILLLEGRSFDRSTEIKAELTRRLVGERLPFSVEFRDPLGPDPALSIRTDAPPSGSEAISLGRLEDPDGCTVAETVERALVRIRRYARGYARDGAEEPATAPWCNPA